MVTPDDEEDEDVHDRTVAVPLRPQVGSQRQRPYLIVIQGSGVGEMHCVRDTMIIGRGSDAEVRVIGEAVSRKHARVVMAGDGSVYIEDLGSTNGTFVEGQPIRRHTLQDGEKIQIGSTTILKFTYHDELEEGFQRGLYDSALRDGLTKIFNKKYFQDRLQSEFAYCHRHKSPLSLLLFDIDFFKRVNDTHGHLAGDHVLVQVAKIMTQSIRTEDVFARVGGEEFAVLCRGIAATPAKLFGTRLRQTIERTPMVFEGTPLNVTISMGIATVPDANAPTAEAFVALADEALYEAKRTGRNRVVAKLPSDG